MKKSFPTQPTLLMAALLLLLAPFGVRAQTGPAGVGNSSNNRYWLDAHSLGFPDGSSVTNWEDISGNGTDFSQFSSDRRPTYVTSGIAGLPSLSYDGLNDVLVAASNANMESSALTYFLVYDRVGTATSMLINGDYASSFRKFRTYSNNGQNRLYSVNFSPGINHIYYDDLGPASFMSTDMSAAGIHTYNQGTLMATNPNPYTAPTGHVGIYLGSRLAEPVPTYNFNGLLSEVIIYNGTINPLERILIENYLGAKYGMSIPTDMYAYEETHKFGLIGLADDGTDTQTSARGAGVLELSSPVSMSSGEHFIVANTDFPLSEFSTSDLPVSLPAHQRFSRTWRIDESGDIGTTTLTFYLAAEDFAESPSYRLLVDTDGDFTDATIHTGTYDAGTSSVEFVVNLSDGDIFTLSGIEEVLYIHSVLNGDWSSTATWDCSCIPGANDIVFIDAATEVTVDIDAYVDYLEIEFDGLLIMDTDVTLDINGDWDITGETNFTDGTISLTGDVAQDVAIGAADAYTLTFNDLLINNTSDDDITFINSTFILNGTLFPNRGNIVFDASTEFIVASSSATTGGRIAAIISPTTITGNVTVQRSIASGNSTYRNLCSPVIGSTFEQWDPDLAMSGPGFPDGCAYGLDGCFWSVHYIEASIYGDVNNVTDPIVNGRGFEIFVGTGLDEYIGTVLNSTGPLNTSADISRAIPTGWATIGNPYASPITYNTISKTSQISKYYYVFDAITGGYQWYDQVSGTSSVPEITSSGLISSGQAVWVKASSAGSITFSQFDKSDQDATFIRTSGLGDNALAVKLNENNSTYSCTVFLEEYGMASDMEDDTIDVYHLHTGIEKGPSFAIAANAELLRKNYIRENGREKSFDLIAEVLNEGYYTISIENWANFRHYQKILLLDKETGETVNLKETNYVFYATVNNPDLKSNSRFTLLLSNNENADENNVVYSTENTDITDSNDLKINQIGNSISIISTQNYDDVTTITVTNVLGQKTVFTASTSLVSGSNIITLPSHLKGFHIITLRTGVNIISHKIVL